MTVTYYLNNGRQKNLYCRINHGSKRVSFSLSYRIDSKNWDAKRDEIKYDDPKFFILRWLKRYIKRRFDEIQDNNNIDTVLAILKSEIKDLTENNNLEGLEKVRWEKENEGTNLPAFDDFILGIEKFTGTKAENLSINIYENSMRFENIDGQNYKIDSWEGTKSRIKFDIENKNYDELYTGTESNIWSNIFEDPGIEKDEFLPTLLFEWEDYWRNKKESCHPNVFPRIKEESWHKFIVFMNCYTPSNAFDLAERLSDINFLPLLIISMCSIYDLDSCLEEYLDYYFSSRYDWESIDLTDSPDDFESPIFYIRESEF